jgi:hypothetical protein
MGEVRGAYNILVGRPEGRIPLGRPGDVDWIHWAQYRDRWWALVNMVMNIAVFWVVAPCKFLPDYTVLQPRRQQSSYSPP